MLLVWVQFVPSSLPHQQKRNQRRCNNNVPVGQCNQHVASQCNSQRFGEETTATGNNGDWKQQRLHATITTTNNANDHKEEEQQKKSNTTTMTITNTNNYYN
jgi:hypothetical protein